MSVPTSDMLTAAQLVARKYEADGDDVVQVYQNLRFDKHIRLMRDRMGLASGTRVLDLGCGTGALVVELAKAGAHVVGLDTFEEAGGIDRQIAEARLREAGVSAQLLAGSAAALPFENGQFDLVVNIGMLEHIPPVGRQRMLAEMLRVVRPGGHLFLIAGPTAMTPFDQHIPGHSFSNWLPRERKIRLSDRTGRRQFLAVPWPIPRRELRAAFKGAAITNWYGDFLALKPQTPLGPFDGTLWWFVVFAKRRMGLNWLVGAVAHLLYVLHFEHCHILSVTKPLPTKP